MKGRLPDGPFVFLVEDVCAIVAVGLLADCAKLALPGLGLQLGDGRCTMKDFSAAAARRTYI